MSSSSVLNSGLDPQCTHLKSFLSDTKFSDKYKAVVTWGYHRSQDASRRHVKRRKVSPPICGTCSTALSNPFACLTCEFTGCWDRKNNHVVTHATSNGHLFFLHSRSGQVYCSSCNDFMYFSELDKLCLSAEVAAEERLTSYQAEKKTRARFQSWTADDKEIMALAAFQVVACQSRRGLINLGQTCFMNVILQSLAHNPLIRNYFLGDKHNHLSCKVEGDGCTCCEMDKLFTEIYSESAAPYGPVSFLFTSYKKSASSSELSMGYAQHDAHEFFISTLNAIHQTTRGSTNISCNCVVHQTFAGQLKSEVKCEGCGNVTSTVDPMLDISLELVRGEVDNLAACLRRFTHPEKLGAKDYTCGKCKASHEALKSLSILRLPPVLSFQFKRFEHKSIDKSSPSKVDTPVRFPASISMAPYTSLGMSEHNSNPNMSISAFPRSMFEYDLFAVINHEGQMDNGHYTNYARSGDEWYRFDDDKVTHASLKTCLSSASSVYMCFYIKKHVEYKPYVTPTYVIKYETAEAQAQERELEKEKARQKEFEDELLATL